MKCKKLLVAVMAIFMGASCVMTSACDLSNTFGDDDVTTSAGGGSNDTDDNQSGTSGDDNQSGGETDGTVGGDNSDSSNGEQTPDEGNGEMNDTDDNQSGTSGDDNQSGGGTDGTVGDTQTPDEDNDEDNGEDDDDDEDEDNVDDGSAPQVTSSFVTYVSGGNECAAIEWKETQRANVTVSYKKSGATSYTKIDDELIRMIDGKTARADILGLSAGTYDFLIDGVATITVSSVTVSAYDRSGYANYGSTLAGNSIGAYNSDGTLKSNAVVVYVSEETKNSVTLTYKKQKYEGIVAILTGLKDIGVPVAVRVIGQISAATWKQIIYAGNTFDKTAKTAITPSDVKSADGTLSLLDYVTDKSSGQTFTQAQLLALGMNELDTAQYSVLEGLELTSKIKYDASKQEFDSCWNDCQISSAKYVTLEGVGEGAEIFQWGLTWKNCNYIEVRNLTFDDYTEDACSFEGGSDSTAADGFTSKYIWVHNNTFNEGINYWDVCNEQDKHEGDGATDFKKLSYVTLSYNKYYKNHKTGLIGGGDTQTTASVTFHHNYYLNCVSRLPLARQANMHMYNNYYCGSTGTNMSIRAGGYAFIENCYFDNANEPIQTQSGDSKRGVAKVYGCIFSGKTYNTSYNVTEVTDRTQYVDNDNIFNKSFDTDSSAFYYDSVNKKSDVSVMYTAEQTKELVPLLAGAAKRNNMLDDSDITDNSAGDANGEQTPDGNTDTDNNTATDDNTDNRSATSVILFSKGAQQLVNGELSSTLSDCKVTVTGDNKSAKYMYNGLEYSNPLKLNSKGSATITVDKDCTVTVCYYDYANAGKSTIKINGTTYGGKSDTIKTCDIGGTTYYYDLINIEMEAGTTYTIVQGTSNEISLCYLVLTYSA